MSTWITTTISSMTYTFVCRVFDLSRHFTLVINFLCSDAHLNIVCIPLSWNALSTQQCNCLPLCLPGNFYQNGRSYFRFHAPFAKLHQQCLLWWHLFFAGTLHVCVFCAFVIPDGGHHIYGCETRRLQFASNDDHLQQFSSSSMSFSNIFKWRSVAKNLHKFHNRLPRVL